MRYYKARAIVLGTLKYGDNALVVELLTDLLGRQSYLVQGVRSTRPSSRFRGNKAAHYQPMGLIEIEGYQVPHGQMHRIREVRNLLPLNSLRLDARKGAIALFISELLHRLVREVEPNSPLFDFVTGAVEALDGLAEEAAVANFHLWFLVRFSALLGFYPAGEPRTGDWFDIREGLFTPHPSDPHLAIEPADAAILAQLMALEIDSLGTLPLNGARRSRFLGRLINYLGYHLDIRSVQSLEVLKEIF